MKRSWIPTEEELDALLRSPPVYDADAVKRRTLDRIAGPQKRAGGKRRTALRGLCIAAVVCALSASALAVANYATQGGIAAALGLGNPAAEEAPGPAEAPVSAPPAPPAAKPEAKPEAEKAEELPPELGAYEMDERVAQYLKVPEVRKEELKPLGQSLNLVARTDGAKLTVLQTLGDGSNLYVLLRVDFPEEFPLTEEMDFRHKELELRNTDEMSSTQFTAQHWEELERTAHSIVYLAAVGSGNGISGQTALVTLEEFGRDAALPEQDAFLLVDAGRATQCTFVPDGTGGYWPSDTQPGSSMVRTGDDGVSLRIGGGSHDLFTEGWEQALAENGGTLGCRWEDGSIAVLVKSDRNALVYLDGAAKRVSVTYGDTTAELDPSYERLLTGRLTQSWVLDYQDVSRSWTVELPGEDGRAVEVGTLKVSPLSMYLDLAGSEEAQAPVEKTRGARQTVALRLADGTEIAPPMTWERWPKAGISVRMQFERVVDPADVAGLTGFGLEFTLRPKE